MSDRALRFTEVRIDRMPGVPAGRGFTLADLSPDVTLVLGPNGAGKTVSARALMELLWPGETGLERPSIGGGWDLDGERWTVDIDSGHVVSRRDGEEAVLPTLPPAEARTHHRLGLRELLVDGGPDDDATQAFARRIARAMQGGYDLDAAATVLRFTPRPTKPRGDRTIYDQRRAALEAAEAKERERHEDSERLARLEAEQEAARTAAVDAQRLAWMIDLRQASDELAAAEAAIAAYDPRLGKMTGDEGTRLEGLRDERLRLETRRAAAADRVRDAGADAAATGLPEGGVPGTVRSRLAADVDAIEEASRQRRALAGELAAAAGRRDSARIAIGEAVDAERLGELGSVPAAELTRHARDGAGVRAAAAVADRLMQEAAQRQAAVAARMSDLGAETPDELASLADRGRRGRDALAAWLGTPAAAVANGTESEAARWSWPLIAAAGLACVLAGILGVIVHPAWWGAVAAAVVLVVFGRPDARPAAAPAADARGARAGDYGRLDLPAPAAWSVEAVQDALDARVRELVRFEQMVEERRLVDAAQVEAERTAASATTDRSRHAAAAEALAARIGVPIEPDHDDWLHVLGSNLLAWQEADRRVAELTRELDTVGTQIDAFVDRCRAAAEPFVDADAIESLDAASVRPMQRDLEERSQARQSADAAQASARRDLDREVETLADVDRRRAAIFAALELDADRPEDREVLDDWLRALAAYRAGEQRIRDARGSMDAIRRKLGDDAEVPTGELAVLEAERAAARATADRLAEIAGEIGSVTREVELARAGHTVEAAAHACEAAAQVLLDDRAAAEVAVVGASLVDWVREEATDRTQPEVLRQASGVFRRITHGRYELQLDPGAGGDPNFVARDTVEGVVKRLDDLSAGERVQLLLSVRLGFLEQQEGGVRLPIVLDEILGTTDDPRASAIIDAVAEICRAGRQVFYFTAQPDEVGKWMARLGDDPELVLRVVDLAAVRGLAEAESAPMPIDRPALPTVPAPAGRDHETYGRDLGVPGLRPTDGVGAVHLWYVIDDAESLHEVLSRQVRAIGPFLSLARGGAMGALGAVDALLVDRVDARRRAIDAAFAAWGVGRGRPVDGLVLTASGAVSDRYAERVTELARAAGGDATTLLAALEDGEAPGFRRNKIQELRIFLEEHGHLDHEPRLDTEGIMHRVLRSVADDLQAGRLEHDWVRTMIARLPDVNHSGA